MFDFDKKKRPIVLFGFGNLGHRVYEILLSYFTQVHVVVQDEKEFAQAKEIAGPSSVSKVDYKEDHELINIGLEKKILFCAMDEMAINIFLVLALRSIVKKATIVSISTSAENSRKLKFIGADKVIDMYEASANRIVDIVTRPSVTRVLDEIVYIDNGISIEEIEIPKDSFLDGIYLHEVDFHTFGLILLGIVDREMGDQFIFVSRGIDHKFDAGDVLVLVGESFELESFYDRLYGSIDKEQEKR